MDDMSEEELRKLQKDCIECKIIGCSTMAITASYAIFRGCTLPKTATSSRLIYGGLSLFFGGMAIYRAYI
jgi:hypothetical protein